jgi:hypothetical protein
MPKIYKDRAMEIKKEDFGDDELSIFFFPKNNPPVAVRAKTIEKAEAILAANTKENE